MGPNHLTAYSLQTTQIREVLLKTLSLVVSAGFVLAVLSSAAFSGAQVKKRPSVLSFSDVYRYTLEIDGIGTFTLPGDTVINLGDTECNSMSDERTGRQFLGTGRSRINDVKLEIRQWDNSTRALLLWYRQIFQGESQTKNMGLFVTDRNGREVFRVSFFQCWPRRIDLKADTGSFPVIQVHIVVNSMDYLR